MFVLFFLVVIEENIKYFYCFRKNSFFYPHQVLLGEILLGERHYFVYIF